MNYLDLIIILVLLYYLFDGFRRGFLRVFSELFGFFLSILLALKFYGWAGSLIGDKFNLPYSLAKVAGFFAILISVQIIYSLFIYFLYRKIPQGLQNSLYNRLFGLLPAFFKGLIFLAIWLSFLVFIPFLPKLKNELDNSRLGKPLVSRTLSWESKFEQIFSGVLEETLTFLTTKEGERKPLVLNIPVKMTVDETCENKMGELVNRERKKFNLSPLKMDEKLKEVARAHSKDMWERNYFGHQTPEGLSPFDRLKKAGISFLAAGENLALAPNVELAHQGLMASPSHRENILSPFFHKVGIGCIDGGIYGKMISQEFTD